MGIIKQGILGGFSGKVGPVIGSSWKGIDYMKGVPTSVANPRTAPQVAQRTKFTNVVDFSKVILASVIKPLRDRFAVQMSGFNSFVQDNISLFTLPMPAPAEDLIIASGKMEATEFTFEDGIIPASGAKIHWVDDSGSGYKLATDKAYMVAVNQNQEIVAFSAAAAVRSDLVASVDFGAVNVAGDTLNVYLVFLREDGTVVSNTAFGTQNYV